MKVVVLPSMIGRGRGQALAGILIDGKLAIDAGPLGMIGSIKKQSEIRDVFLTHSHMDHVAGLPILIDNVYEPDDRCVTVRGSAETLMSLREDVFNGRVFPNMVKMSEQMPPFLKIEEIAPRHPIEVGKYTVRAVPVNHVVPTFAYVVEDGQAAIAVITDTAPTEEIWQALAHTPSLKAIFLECAFPNEKLDIARAAMHLTPALFLSETRKAPPGVPVYAIHLKPAFEKLIRLELRALKQKQIKIARAGRTYRFPKPSYSTTRW